ncbi:MAG TPA: DUF427 domain-containing protein [Alphaproteobacteria bacterium]|nr:DUF427 domain-containing protein [Alphaproteobacteria bacterium]
MSSEKDGRRSAWAKHPDYRVDFEQTAKRVRVRLGGQTVADSTDARIMLETRHTPVYYRPRADVRMDLAERTDHESFCPFKGEASYWTLVVGDQSAENAMWSYEQPFPEVAGIRDYVAFYWDRVDAWFEEDEEIFVHPRDPHVRIDVLASSRPLRALLGGEVIAETTAARFLFETGWQTRYYIPQADVRMDLLVESASETACPYKGGTRYWSARVDGRLIEDVAWSYSEPLPEVGRIKDYLCFYEDKLDALYIADEKIE